MPCARVLTRGDIPLDHSTNHLQNMWHFVSDLQWRGVSIQISSLRTRLNIDTPLHCKSDTNYHLFCKYNILIVPCAWTRGTTRWCRVQKFTCCSTGSRHQYIVIWWGWHYRIFSVLLSRLLRSWMINGESLSVNYW
jgi:hypothetical protein